MKAWIDGKEAPIPDAAKAAVGSGPAEARGERGGRGRLAHREVLRRGEPLPGGDPQGPRQRHEGAASSSPCSAAPGYHRRGDPVPPGLHHLRRSRHRRASAQGSGPDGTDVERKISESEPASCFVFKTAMDQFTGKLSYFKVMSGKISADADLLIAREGKKEKITKVYTCLGKKLEDASELVGRRPRAVHEERVPADERHAARAERPDRLSRPRAAHARALARHHRQRRRRTRTR